MLIFSFSRGLNVGDRLFLSTCCENCVIFSTNIEMNGFSEIILWKIQLIYIFMIIFNCNNFYQICLHYILSAVRGGGNFLQNITNFSLFFPIFESFSLFSSKLNNVNGVWSNILYKQSRLKLIVYWIIFDYNFPLKWRKN